MPTYPTRQLNHLPYTAKDVYRATRSYRHASPSALFQGLPSYADRGLKMLSKSEDIQQTFDEIMKSDGLNAKFPLGHLPKMFGPERNRGLIGNYVNHMVAGWKTVFEGIPNGLERLDPPTVRGIRLLAPAFTEDLMAVEDLLEESAIFGRFDPAEILQLMTNLNKVQEPLLDLESLVQDWKLMACCVSATRDLLASRAYDQMSCEQYHRLLRFAFEHIEDLVPSCVLISTPSAPVIDTWREFADLALQLQLEPIPFVPQVHPAPRRRPGSDRACEHPTRDILTQKRRQGRPDRRMQAQLRREHNASREHGGTRERPRRVSATSLRQSKIRAFLDPVDNDVSYSIDFPLDQYYGAASTTPPRSVPHQMTERPDSRAALSSRVRNTATQRRPSRSVTRRRSRSPRESLETRDALMPSRDRTSGTNEPARTYQEAIGSFPPFSPFPPSSRYSTLSGDAVDVDNVARMPIAGSEPHPTRSGSVLGRSPSSGRVAEPPADTISVYVLGRGGFRLLERVGRAEWRVKIGEYAGRYLLYDGEMRSHSSEQLRRAERQGQYPPSVFLLERGAQGVEIDENVRVAAKAVLFNHF